MTKQKAVFIDIDGTLYDSSIKGVRPATKEILEVLAKDSTIDIYISTGRSWSTITSVIDGLPPFKGFNLVNGQKIIINNNCIYNGAMNIKDVNKFLMFCNEHNYSIACMEDDALYVNMYNTRSKNNFDNYIKTPIVMLEGRKFRNDEIINQIWLFEANDVVEKVAPMFPEFAIIKWGNFGADVIPHLASKGRGVRQIIEDMKYDINNTYAFGDADNDVEMFKSVGTSICMGNGSADAKAAATFITVDIKEEGLAKSLKQFLINKDDVQ